jgi:uncharacterized protein YjbI with pentapeptide repeats
MTSLSSSQQVEEAISMVQDWAMSCLRWVITYLSIFSQEALDHPFDAANAITRLLGPLATLVGARIVFLTYQNELKKRADEKEKNEKAAKLSESRLAEEKNKNADDAKRAESRLISERFSKAIEQLAHEDIYIRLGGIYSLEKIARDSPEDHWRIMQVLTAFIRESSQIKRGLEKNDPETKFPTDLQGALTVIIHRNWHNDHDNKGLDLSYTNLRNADLTDFSKSRDISRESPNLCNANLSNANLSNANLSNVNLSNADLFNADLGGANLSHSNLRNTDLQLTNLRNANLESADLYGNTKLWSVQLQNANLTASDIRKADFYGAKLAGANLKGAKLEGTDLKRANLELVSIDEEQLKMAKLSQETVMPNGQKYDGAISLRDQCTINPK